MASIAQHNSNSDRYFAALAVAELRALHSFFDQHIVEDLSLDTSLWTRATTTRSRHTLQRALCIRCMGQYSMSFDRKSRAGTGSGSCPFSWSPGLNFCQNRWLDNSAF